MKISVTHILLMIIAGLLAVISFLLFHFTFSKTSKNPTSVPENTHAVEENFLPVSRTRTKELSFVSWSTSTDTPNPDQPEFRLFNENTEDPFLETITFIKDLRAYKKNPETDDNYKLVSSKTVFGTNTYAIYQHSEQKTRVFVLKRSTGEAILISLKDAEATVPHYVDLSSVTFEDLTSE